MAGTDAEAMEGSCLLACFLMGLLSLLSYCTQDQGWPHPQWAGPSHINLRKCSTGLPVALSCGGVFSVEGLSPHVTVTCVNSSRHK